MDEKADEGKNSGSQDDQLKKGNDDIAEERLENKSENGVESECQIHNNHIVTITADNSPESQDKTLGII